MKVKKDDMMVAGEEAGFLDIIMKEIERVDEKDLVPTAIFHARESFLKRSMIDTGESEMHSSVANSMLSLNSQLPLNKPEDIIVRPIIEIFSSAIGIAFFDLLHHGLNETRDSVEDIVNFCGSLFLSHFVTCRRYFLGTLDEDVKNPLTELGVSMMKGEQVDRQKFLSASIEICKLNILPDEVDDDIKYATICIQDVIYQMLLTPEASDSMMLALHDISTGILIMCCGKPVEPIEP